MRAAPALGVTVRRSPHWWAALAGLVALVAASTAAWVLQRGDARAALLLPAVLLLGAILLWRAWRTPPRQLRWDGQGWWLGAPGADAQPGGLRLALDLGDWLLLRFRAVPGGAVAWLPLQRTGLEADWHALRCALYSPRPAAAPTQANDPSA